MIARPKLQNLRPMVGVLNTSVARPAAKTVDPLYLTPDHRAWRATIIARAGGLCEAPDCQTPGRRGSRMFADHIIEIRDGGAPFDPLNGQCLCGSCHTAKTISERTRRMALPT